MNKRAVLTLRGQLGRYEPRQKHATYNEKPDNAQWPKGWAFQLLTGAYYLIIFKRRAIVFMRSAILLL